MLSLAQAATMATAYANQRWSLSDEAYRISVSEKSYESNLQAICGVNGVGGEYPFPVKKRPAREHGDWTFSTSVEKRPQVTGSIYERGKKAASLALNKYSPLFRMLCPGGAKPSGWNDDDVWHAMVFNLRTDAKARVEKSKTVNVAQTPAPKASTREDRASARASRDMSSGGSASRRKRPRTSDERDAELLAGSADFMGFNDPSLDFSLPNSPTSAPADAASSHSPPVATALPDGALPNGAAAAPAPDATPVDAELEIDEDATPDAKKANAADEELQITEAEMNLEYMQAQAHRAELESWLEKNEIFFLTWWKLGCGPVGMRTLLSAPLAPALSRLAAHSPLSPCSS